MGSLPPGYPPDYPPPPPPPPPPPEAPAAPSPAPPAPEYPYALTASPPNAGRRPSSRQLWTIMAVITGVALLLVIGGTYGVAGYYSASSRLGSANHALGAALAHRDAFDNAPSALELDAPDAKTMQSDAAKFAQTWKEQAATIQNDERALASAGSSLHQQQWLTFVQRGNIDSTSARVDHARKALETAGTIAGKRVKEGEFELAFANTAADFDTVIGDFQAQQFSAAVAAANKMQTDANDAFALTADSQFPSEVHDYLAAIQGLAKDFVDYLAAVGRGDTTGAKSLIDKANNDVDALQNFDLTAMGEKVDAYYQPLIDSYHAELSQAQ